MLEIYQENKLSSSVSHSGPKSKHRKHSVVRILFIISKYSPNLRHCIKWTQNHGPSQGTHGMCRPSVIRNHGYPVISDMQNQRKGCLWKFRNRNRKETPPSEVKHWLRTPSSAQQDHFNILKEKDIKKPIKFSFHSSWKCGLKLKSQEAHDNNVLWPWARKGGVASKRSALSRVLSRVWTLHRSLPHSTGTASQPSVARMQMDF